MKNRPTEKKKRQKPYNQTTSNLTTQEQTLTQEQKINLENLKRIMVSEKTSLLSLMVWFVGFYGISTIVGYLMPNPFLCK